MCAAATQLLSLLLPLNRWACYCHQTARPATATQPLGLLLPPNRWACYRHSTAGPATATEPLGLLLLLNRWACYCHLSCRCLAPLEQPPSSACCRHFSPHIRTELSVAAATASALTRSYTSCCYCSWTTKPAATASASPGPLCCGAAAPPHCGRNTRSRCNSHHRCYSHRCYGRHCLRA